MKKALVLLLALVFVGGMAAFADMAAPTVAINGFVETGAGFLLPGSIQGGTTPASSAIQYNNDSGNAGRLRLGIAITAADGNSGFVSRLEGDQGIIGNAGNNSSAGLYVMGFNRLAGWGKFLGGMLTIKGGILDDTQFWTANRNWGGWLDGAAGLEALVNAYPGLTIGYFLPLPFAAPANIATAPFTGVFYAGPGTPSNIMETLNGSAIYAHYNMPNMVDVVAGFHFAHASGLSTATGLPMDQYQTGYLWAGVDVLAFPGITARAEVQLQNIGNNQSAAVGGNYAGQYNFFFEGAYVYPLGDGKLKADLAIWLYVYPASNSDMGYDFEPNISYDFGVAKVGIVGDFGNFKAPYNPINNAATYGVTAAPGVQNTKTNFDIGPYVGVPIGTGASVNAGFMYTVGDTSNTTGTGPGAAVYVDVRYSF